MRNDALLKVFGTIHVISNPLLTSTIAAEVEKIADGKPVELVYDAMSLPDTQALAYEVLALGDALLLTRAPQIPEDNKQVDDNNKIVHVFGNVQTHENRQLGIEQYSRLTKWLRTSAIVVRVPPSSDPAVKVDTGTSATPAPTTSKSCCFDFSMSASSS